MNRPREIELIEAVLGYTFTPANLGTYLAFHSPIKQDQQVGGPLEFDRLMKELEQRCLEWHASGYTVFLGYPDVAENYIVFAIPNPDPIRLMDIFDVGNYNDISGDTPERAKRYMATLFATDPFVPYLVDAASFRVRFLNPVGAARAGEIAHAIAEIAPESYELVWSPEDPESAPPESGDEAEDPIECLRQSIMTAQKLELWWD
jgi:hypothetical protein